MRYIGIDPGVKGFLCLLDPSTNHPLFASLDPAKVSSHRLLRTLLAEKDSGPVIAALEDVHSLHGMSAKSNFAFGGMLWRIKTILECAEIDYTLVTPKTWQKDLGVPSRKFLDGEMELKQAVADMAEGYYPTAELYGPRGGLLDGRSDALMIARWIQLQQEA